MFGKRKTNDGFLYFLPEMKDAYIDIFHCLFIGKFPKKYVTDDTMIGSHMYPNVVNILLEGKEDPPKIIVNKDFGVYISTKASCIRVEHEVYAKLMDNFYLECDANDDYKTNPLSNVIVDLVSSMGEKPTAATKFKDLFTFKRDTVGEFIEKISLYNNSYIILGSDKISSNNIRFGFSYGAHIIQNAILSIEKMSTEPSRKMIRVIFDDKTEVYENMKYYIGPRFSYNNFIPTNVSLRTKLIIDINQYFSSKIYNSITELMRDIRVLPERYNLNKTMTQYNILHKLLE